MTDLEDCGGVDLGAACTDNLLAEKRCGDWEVFLYVNDERTSNPKTLAKSVFTKIPFSSPPQFF